MITHSNMASRYKNEWIRKKMFKPQCRHSDCNDKYRCENLSYLEVNENLISVRNSYKYNILNGDSFIVKELLRDTLEEHTVFKDKTDKNPIILKFIDVVIYRYPINNTKPIEQRVKIILLHYDPCPKHIDFDAK